MERHGTPEISNTDQGSQFTSEAYLGVLRDAGVRISMDGRGRWIDNRFIERLWRSLKYESVYLVEADGRAPCAPCDHLVDGLLQPRTPTHGAGRGDTRRSVPGEQGKHCPGGGRMSANRQARRAALRSLRSLRTARRALARTITAAFTAR